VEGPPETKIFRRCVREDLDLARFDQPSHVRVEERRLAGMKQELDLTCLARLEVQLLEADELEHRPGHGRVGIADVELDGLASGSWTAVCGLAA